LANFSDDEIALVDDYLKLGGRMEHENLARTGAEAHG